MKRAVVSVLSVVLLAIGATALDPKPDDVFVRVIDVGAGLCVVVKMPGDHYMVYDAGNFTDGGNRCFEGVAEVIPDGEEIDLMVLSHSDADHLGAVDEILDAYKVNRIIRSGFIRSTNTWRAANDAIELEVAGEGARDINLRVSEFPPGATYRFGETFVTVVAAFHKPPADWDIISTSEKRNAGSIVIRLQYKGKSILFCGDAVGRHLNDPPDSLLATEKFMLDMSPAIPIDSDVLIAPHHGADNGSSTAFIQAVSPRHVIFSAGHKHQHPRASTAQRYRDNGVSVNRMFRTDLGDNEGGNEWTHGSTSQRDPVGDDDVDILIRANGQIVVEYRNPH